MWPPQAPLIFKKQMYGSKHFHLRGKYLTSQFMTMLSKAQDPPNNMQAIALLAAMLLASPVIVQFDDAAKSAGIQFVHHKGSREISTILEEAGPGVCVADFDGDGFQDIYFVNGRNMHGEEAVARNALYRNNGDGTFTDVTEKANVPGNAYGLGCVWGDFDNDGHPDLYVTQFGKNILYHNNGDGTFTDVTQKARVDGADFGTMFHTGATFFNYRSRWLSRPLRRRLCRVWSEKPADLRNRLRRAGELPALRV